jgi:limonene-1,2-epoxide hydrolase
MKSAHQTGATSKEVILSFISALNAEDYETARLYVDDNMKFNGVLGSRNSAEDYFKDMKKMKFKYKIKKSFEDGNDVCLFYDIDMNGQPVFTCGWYQVDNGKIISLQVVFDPRPVLAA